MITKSRPRRRTRSLGFEVQIFDVQGLRISQVIVTRSRLVGCCGRMCSGDFLVAFVVNGMMTIYIPIREELQGYFPLKASLRNCG